MLYVVNDLHGAKNLIDQTLNEMDLLDRGSVLIINGDGAGARGPIMNQIVKIFYEVRRGETDMNVLIDALRDIVGVWPAIDPELVFQSVHAGVFRKVMSNRFTAFEKLMRKETTEVLEETLKPLSAKAQEKGIKIVYLAGNGEIVTDDFIVDDITVEATVQPEDRFYQKLHRDGFFERLGVDYVPYATVIDDTLLISTNLLDMSFSNQEMIMEDVVHDWKNIANVVVHYPPAVAPIGRAFEFWNPNSSDLKRANSLAEVLDMANISSLAKLYFGHIHLGPNDERMKRYPRLMGFRTSNFDYCYWVKPGCIVKI